MVSGYRQKPKLVYRESTYMLKVSSNEYKPFYVVNETTDVDMINLMFASSNPYVVFQPGKYNLSQSIRITRNNAVMFGMGLPILSNLGPHSCIVIENDVSGVSLSGFVVNAGSYSKNTTLIMVGETVGPGDAARPNILYDMYPRVGPNFTPTVYFAAYAMVQINTGYTIIENMWAWRADHDENSILVTDEHNPVTVGIQVNGDHVTTYGLASEHAIGKNVEWNGADGTVYYYQSEFAYDALQSTALEGFDATSASNFKGFGMGVYSYFVSYPHDQSTAMRIPDGTWQNALSVWLNGFGHINYTVNELGSKVPPFRVRENWKTDTYSSVNISVVCNP